jgi:D-lactate dehydrogenase (cytochrome)
MSSRIISSAAHCIQRQLRLPVQRVSTLSRNLATSARSGPPKRRLARTLALATTAVVAGSIGYGVSQESQHDHRSSYQRRVTELPNTYGSEEDFRRGIAELRAHFTEPGTFSTDPDTLHEHGHAVGSFHDGAPHGVVVYPQSTDDVVLIMKVATRYRIPVTPYSGGTSLEGNFFGVGNNQSNELCLGTNTLQHPRGGICVDMSEMNKIIEINGTPMVPSM